MLQVIFIHVRC